MSEEKKKEEFGSGDIFDIMDLSSKIHSKSDMLHRDYTLAWTNKASEKWSRTQIYCGKLMHDLLVKVDKISAIEISSLLLHEVELKLVQSRSREGRVINAMLRATQSQGQENDEDAKHDMGFLKGLFSKRREEMPQ